jgi:hypothetical protein
MSGGREGCHREQRSRKGERAIECPWAKEHVTMDSIQKGDMNVHWQIGVLLEATLEDGRTHECPL